MPNSTTRLGLLEPVGTDTVSELRLSITNNASTLDNALTGGEGTLANRPSASSVPYNYVYFASDVPAYYLSDGTTWRQMALEPGAADGVALLDATGNVPASELNNILTAAVTTPTRTLDTAYQPNTARPTFVNALAASTTSGAAVGLQIYIGATAADTTPSGHVPTSSATAVDPNSGGVGASVTLDVIVPAGWYYLVHATIGALSSFNLDVHETEL